MVDPNDNRRATFQWEPWGPLFNSVAYATQNVYLSVNYSDGVDTRWPNRAVKGPARTALELTTTFSGTAANANCMASAQTADGTRVGYGGRGTDPFKFKYSDLTLLDPTLAFAGRVNSVAVFQTAGAAQHIAWGINGANDYHVTTASANSGADTDVANSAGQDAEYIAVAPDSMVVLNKQQAYRNILTGSVTPAAPSLNSVNASAPLPNPVTFTGFAVLSGNQWIVGTNTGPYVVQAQFGRFGPIIDRLPPSVDNCRAMKLVEWLGGVVIPLENQTRLQTPGGGLRIGPEAWIGNTSPIQGIVMGADYDANWYICALLNRLTGTYYFLAGRPHQPDDRHTNVVSWYCIGSTTTACELVFFSGTDGGRTLPAWWFGAADDLVRMDAGRTPTWTDDSSYTYSTTDQNLYLTEIRFPSDEKWELDTIGFEARGCAAGARYITAKWVTDDGTTVTLGRFDTNGFQRLKVPYHLREAGSRHAPILTFTSNSATTSPYTVGVVQCEFVESPRQTPGAGTAGDPSTAVGDSGVRRW